MHWMAYSAHHAAEHQTHLTLLCGPATKLSSIAILSYSTTKHGLYAPGWQWLASQDGPLQRQGGPLEWQQQFLVGKQQPMAVPLQAALCQGCQQDDHHGLVQGALAPPLRLDLCPASLLKACRRKHAHPAAVHSAMHFTSAARPLGMQQGMHHQLLKACAQEIEVV